jgi:hypothetical protein
MATVRTRKEIDKVIKDLTELEKMYRNSGATMTSMRIFERIQALKWINGESINIYK